MKKAFIFAITIVLIITASASLCFAIPDEPFKGEAKREVKELYNGVKMTHIELGDDSQFGEKESFWVVECDPKQPYIAIDVTNAGKYSNELYTVKQSMEKFAEINKNKQPLVGVNGDLWMVSYAHARVLGSGTSYGGASDPVVTKSLTLPRGMDIYDGEIITSPHSEKETPYEGPFQCFGITADGRTVLGQPSLTTKVTNLTKNTTAVRITGLNRLPANNAIMLYSDKGCEDNYSLDDAYEVIVDCSYDYKIQSGAKIKGKVTKIVKSGDKNEKMQPNRLIICARGKSFVNKVSGFEIGDELEFSFNISVNKDKDIWADVTNAVGGHIVLIQNGVIQANNDESHYPATIIGNTKDGKIIIIAADGRQSGYTQGLRIKDMPKFVKQLGLYNAFVLDGGGSTTIVAKEGDEYELQNKPSDGSARSVVNSVIISAILPEATEAPETPETPEATTAPQTNEGNKGCGGTVATCTMAVLLQAAIFMRKRKEE